MASAVRTAEAHEVLKQAIRAELAAVESRYDLAAVQARTCLMSLVTIEGLCLQ